MPLHLSPNRVEPHHLSKIFDTHRDEELKFKRKYTSNKLGMVPTFNETPTGLMLGSSDNKFDYFIMAETSSHLLTLTLYRCKGLSNIPMRNNQVESIRKI